MPDLTFPGGKRELRGYLAEPRSEEPWPGVLVIQDSLGLSDDIRLACDRLAAEGYLALAPDLYSGRGLRCVIATVRASRSGEGEAYEDIEAARRWLAEQAGCSGRIGMIGFCMGGGFALMCAPRMELAAASANYGELPSDPESALADACPIVASYGRRDRALRGRAQRLEQVLTDLGIDHDIKEYPDAGHSFMNRINTGPLLGQILAVAGGNYVHSAAEDSWRRILDFFEHHLSADR